MINVIAFLNLFYNVISIGVNAFFQYKQKEENSPIDIFTFDTFGKFSSMVLMRDMEMKSLIKEGRVLHKTIDEASFIRLYYLFGF